MDRQQTPRVHVIGPEDGEVLGPPDLVRDRFVLGQEHTGGRLSLVEHLMAPHALVAPVHVHSQEDEFSFVLEGQVGALLGDETVFAGPGSLIIKPRGEWHTFWNATDVPARILEIISPGGLEDLFRELDLLQSELSPEAFTKRAARYGARIDMERTMELVERHALRF